LGRVEPALLRPYLEKRSDWPQSSKVFDGDNSNNTEKRNYAAKLGAFMENFEGLKLGDGIATNLNLPTMAFRGQIGNQV
jgi:hypothetical protein